MIAKVIDFDTSLLKLINYIKLEMSKEIVPDKTYNKCEEVLRNILEGLSKNPSLQQESLILGKFN
jgi:hypothetical protein